MKRRAAIGVLVALALGAGPVYADGGRLSPQGGTVVGVTATTGGGVTIGGTAARPTVGLVTSCGSGQVLAWSGTAWACAAGGGGGGSGTVTNVSTLSPLQGGPITNTGTISLINCPANDIYKENAGGTAFACAVDSDTTYTAGTGITLGGTAFSLSAIANNTILGNVSGISAAPIALTGTQVTTVLDTMTSTTKGLAPASGGGTTKYYRADGTWSVPPDTNTTYTASTGLLLTGTAFSLNINAGVTQTCGAGTAITTLTGTGTTTCAAFGTSSLTNSAGANVIPKSDGTNLVASSVSDDGTTVTTAESTSVGLDTGTGAKVFNVGRSVGLATNAQNGWSVTTYTDGNVYIDSKTWTNGLTKFRVGQGATTGNVTTWLTVANNGGSTTFAAPMAINGALNLSTHQINNVVDPTLAQDAATKNYVDGHIGASGSLSSGTVPVANGAASLSNSSITDDGAGHVKLGNNFYTYNSNGIGFGYATAATATGLINYYGYAGGATQYRDLGIDDGKSGQVAYFTGSTKAVEFFGAITADTTLGVTGALTATSTAHVVGAATLDSTLGVTGNATLSGTALTTGTSTTTVHVTAKDGTARPTATNCGTGATVVGNDESGFLTVGSAGTITTACKVVFNTTYSSNLSCNATLRSAGSHVLNYSVATTGITLADEASLSPGMVVDYTCREH